MSGKYEAYTDEGRIDRPHPINGIPIKRPYGMRPAPRRSGSHCRRRRL